MEISKKEIHSIKKNHEYLNQHEVFIKSIMFLSKVAFSYVMYVISLSLYKKFNFLIYSFWLLF